MTGNLKLLCNFVEKFLGTVCFGNDQLALILGYGDLVQGNVTINWVYYVEGLNHNLFSVDQFYDADLEVSFRKSTCFVRDLQGNDLLVGNRGSNLYTISLQELTSSTPLYLMAKATPTQAWLWHRRLSYLNFDYINLLSKKDIVIGLPKLKGTEFLNKTLNAFFKEEGIEHQTSTARTPEQNGISTSTPSTHTNVHAEENNNDQAEEEEHVSEYQCMKDHTLEQVCGNPSRPVQTRRQLVKDPKMYEFVNPDHPEKVYRLRKALYGLKQAPRACTSGGIQFLGDKLVSGMSTKQNCTTMLSAEAEYVALSASCA
nr:retrovirus-related Pol polyprotein from transposon TNT 1-94 [Tanacetum cinerariifolium]